MGYAAVSGGAEAILNAEKLLTYFRLKGNSEPLTAVQIKDQLRLAVDKVMGEGALYAPEAAALALKQAEGDMLEAAFILRAYRATQPRRYVTNPVETGTMQIIRRISGVFQDIPGGQILGPTRDYTQRLLDFSLLTEDKERMEKLLQNLGVSNIPEQLPNTFLKVVDLLRVEGLLADLEPSQEIYDITHHTLTFPCSRSAKLQSLCRGETGAMMALAYSAVRGFGSIHPCLAELRVGYIPLYINRPGCEKAVFIGKVLATEAEIVSPGSGYDKNGKSCLTLGYGFCFGHNETKAIAMGILDQSTRNASLVKAPAEDEEFVLYHIDGVEAAGFVNHWKLPHYVTFQSTLDRIRQAQTLGKEKKYAGYKTDKKTD
ncbi:carbon-phosphorus lyase complex subunit PhnI [Pectinatus haikarae]|uniref:Alpha-D-ribose 1-methylphosphonate 5-triphosphate synthase subunit PhnI n=1 Tax=Pectinatus haikarae TaxID=349096 RepID=A0ABT9YA84_9FIRM|nr:carbon-phosphorus lyase complex subunit PhnI [Pectinatus haikarae]MDQ0204639.1 alpha-D-ribose 1-methylphosphonate 5-triphosphate synthase subunit PhnI [Pectinatus haikarae]